MWEEFLFRHEFQFFLYFDMIFAKIEKDVTYKLATKYKFSRKILRQNSYFITNFNFSFTCDIIFMTSFLSQTSLKIVVVSSHCKYFDEIFNFIAYVSNGSKSSLQIFKYFLNRNFFNFTSKILQSNIVFVANVQWHLKSI